MKGNRIAAAAGVATVALAFVELVGPSFPGTGDSAATIDGFFHAHSTWALTAVVVETAGNAFWLVFLAGLVERLRAVGSRLSATAALLGGALNVAIALVGLAVLAAIASRGAGHGTPQTTRVLFELASMTLVVSNGFLALTAVAVAAARVTRVLTVASIVAAAIFAPGAAAYASRGAFAPDGGLQFATYFAELLWTLVASVVLWRAQTSWTYAESSASPPSDSAVIAPSSIGAAS